MYKFYKDENNKVFAYSSDGSQDDFIDEEKLTPIDQDEADQLRNKLNDNDQPLVVSPRKIRKALNEQGLRDQVEAAVATSDDQELKDSWEYATEFVENDPLVSQMASLLGLSDADVHALFELAKTL